jgi:hypothetical protein
VNRKTSRERTTVPKKEVIVSSCQKARRSKGETFTFSTQVEKVDRGNNPFSVCLEIPRNLYRHETKRIKYISLELGQSSIVPHRALRLEIECKLRDITIIKR